ncbi:MAG TPA: hypothetical protein PKA80_13280 [Ignavibacteriaceae bacterium]|nr:hypothetical protein [Ignavibacteriaceae bacterium]
MPELSDLKNNYELIKAVTELLMSEKRPLLEDYIKSKIGRSIFTEKENVARIECRYWKSYSTGTRTDGIDVYYMLREDLEKFWLNEIEILLEELKPEVSVSDLIKKLSDSFINYYALRHNTYSSLEDITYYKSDVGIAHNYDNLIRFIDNHKDKFYTKTDSIYGSNALIKVGLKVWIDRGIAYEPQKIIRSQIIKELKKQVPSILPLKSLTFRINRTPSSAGIPKPFSESLIEEIIKNDESRFKYNYATGLVELIDVLEYLAKVINKKQSLLKEFDHNMQQPGFLVFTYIGQNFPLKEAADYISTRPIIFVKTVNDLSKEFNAIIEEGDFLPSEFIENLRAILPNDTSVLNWLDENVTISFMSSSLDDVKKLGNQLIAKLSPIFNIRNNPGNLFQYTLKSKVEEYYEKNPDKKAF